MVAEDQFPTENDQSNFGVDIPYQYSGSGRLNVMVDGKWVVFESGRSH
ncbi:MAG: hypothetical protein Q4D77_02700 [Peptostreptococcaceae bacterium]|nr:hypothetical protein [Peptostreptococcaceae bacterium]